MITGTFLKKGPMMDEIEAIRQICDLLTINKDFKRFSIQLILNGRDPERILKDALEHDKKLALNGKK